MKQKCRIQMGIAQYKNRATLLRTEDINTKHQLFQMRYITLFNLKGLKSYQPSNFRYEASIVKQTLQSYLADSFWAPWAKLYTSFESALVLNGMAT